MLAQRAREQIDGAATAMHVPFRTAGLRKRCRKRANKPCPCRPARRCTALIRVRTLTRLPTRLRLTPKPHLRLGPATARRDDPQLRMQSVRLRRCRELRADVTTTVLGPYGRAEASLSSLKSQEGHRHRSGANPAGLPNPRRVLCRRLSRQGNRRSGVKPIGLLVSRRELHRNSASPLSSTPCRSPRRMCLTAGLSLKLQLARPFPAALCKCASGGS